MNAEWRALTWHEYTMRLWHWNERHSGHDEPKIDPARARAAFEKASLH